MKLKQPNNKPPVVTMIFITQGAKITVRCGKHIGIFLLPTNKKSNGNKKYGS